jgi:serine/threonine protein kinase
MGDAQELAAGVRPGDVLAGKYRIDRILGMGGMGVVVAAHHLHLDDRVAIKFLLPEALANQEAVARFAREAQAAVRIKSEHVARVTDVGKLENGSPYMVMEYLEGKDLGGLLADQGPLPVESVIEFVLQACEALAEAHAIGIVHRDLKPANLFVIRRPDGSQSVKVLDFGISKRTGLGASGDAMTRTSAVLGSPLYMSPEQLRSARDVDARGDIWAIGVILYELLGGDPPFLAESLPELVLKVVSDRPASLRSKRRDVPEGLERAIFTCMEKEPSRRFESVGALARAIAPYGPPGGQASVDRVTRILSGAGAPSSAALSQAALPKPVEAKSANTMANWGQTASHSRRGRHTTLIATASVLLLALAAVGYVFLGRSSKTDTSAVPVTASAPVTTIAPSAPVAAASPPSATATAAPSVVPAVTPAVPPTTGASAPPVAKALPRPRGSAASPRKPNSPSRDVYDDRK